ncbi:MAG: DNA-binding response regulator [Halothiobacillus sp. 14-56-357]|jgi:two-component system KDP operon response regulator KdpE|uniref:response regulator n=1 Tax=Halothiobacillus sp. 15-55-196 TaxID=1970382 RepID=UPI000BD5BB02|nr:response regulator transcription factor [Halothiobacillus sp. 15-55-196]OZB36933.1 MAG: DNA-binding response regulator [Halothiobacillus sp. 15-55-196]OZB56592.1 MAG: DNA-binding response regulator [Halothiobacillus sp. 14-56-357]OZB78484.1 MAG: DNA-binding response regulator [Halothiobacillus sp. 13-55-115]
MMERPNETIASAPAARILVIDDEPQIRKFIDISLRSQGYATLLAGTGREGLTLLASKGADLVVLDLGLPDMDGRDVLKELRQWSRVPVIVLTVRSGDEEKVALLDAGANDYVTKPFSVEELMARIRAFLRTVRSSLEEGPVYDDGTVSIDLVNRKVTVHGQIVTLSRKEFSLLSLLALQPGRLITQKQILRELWGPTHDEDAHYLRILVGKLRQKLGDDASAPRYIVTEPGVGLRFIAKERQTD